MNTIEPGIYLHSDDGIQFTVLLADGAESVQLPAATPAKDLLDAVSIDYGIPEGADRPAPGHGGEGPAHPQGLCRGAAEGGVHPHRDRLQSEAGSGFHVGLGR